MKWINHTLNFSNQLHYFRFNQKASSIWMRGCITASAVRRLHLNYQSHERTYNRTEEGCNKKPWIFWSTISISTLISGALLYSRMEEMQATSLENEKQLNKFPFYTKEEVQTHKHKDTGIWVTFKDEVFNITDFVDQHPGGEIILEAAGGSLEPFWDLYAVHKSPEVLQILREYKIGHLKEGSVSADTKTVDPYALEPKRHPALKASSKTPFNAEPPLDLLVENYITPVEYFYVRNHLPVPEVDPNDYKLEIKVEGKKPLVLNLFELKNKFPKHTVTAVVQCAGNRRSEMNLIKQVKGLNWEAAVIGNAVWSGAKLRDILIAAGFEEEEMKDLVEHIQFEGLDVDGSGKPYGASIPVEKAFDPNGDVLLAYEMNGEPLSRDHGYPLRVIVPGIVGARNVKWVTRIIASKEESQSHWQQNDYKGFPPQIDWDTVDFKSAPAIQEMPVQSAICVPANKSTVVLKDNRLNVKGYAWSGGGRGIIRVDVSVDGGRNWHTAELKQKQSKLFKSWDWTLWEVNVPILKNDQEGDIVICCRAVDSSYNIQPENVAAIWNLRGVLNNAWHHIRVNVQA